MKIKDLTPKMGNVDVVVEIVEVGEPREFQKFGKPGKVATAVSKDDTGQIKLSLWNEQVDQISKGDRVHITDGYVSEWQGEMQLTTGRNGKFEIVEKKSPSAEKLVDEADEDKSGSETGVEEEEVK